VVDVESCKQDSTSIISTTYKRVIFMFEHEIEGILHGSDYSLPEFVAQQWAQNQEGLEGVSEIVVDVGGVSVALVRDEDGDFLGTIVSEIDWQSL
jgi:hypothetical protein